MERADPASGVAAASCAPNTGPSDETTVASDERCLTGVPFCTAGDPGTGVRGSTLGLCVCTCAGAGGEIGAVEMPVAFGAKFWGSLADDVRAVVAVSLGTVFAAASAAIAATVAVALAVSVAFPGGAAGFGETFADWSWTGCALSSILIGWRVTRRPSRVGIVLIEARRFRSCGVKVGSNSGVT